MIAAGTATPAQSAGFVEETPTAAQSFFNRLGVAGLIAAAPASILFLSFNDGGFFPDTTGLAAIGFAVLLVLRTTLAEHPFAGYNKQLAVPLLALAFFGLWQLASALWSHDTARALDEYDRTLLYLLAFALFGSIPRTPARMQWLIRALAAGMTAVCLSGLISRVLPHVWPTATHFFANRLNYPLTYWNAEGLLAAVTTILLIHLTASEEEHPVMRVLGATFVPATAATLLLTFSRGAIVVGVIGVVVYLVFGRPRRVLGAAVAIVPTSAIALHSVYAAELLASYHPASHAAVIQGRHVAVTVVLCMLAAGAVRAVMLLPDLWLSRATSNIHIPKPPLLPTAMIGVTALVIGILALSLSGFVGREYNKFAHGGRPTTSRVTRNRLSSFSGENRAEQWRIALHAFRHRPLLGQGAGTYQFYYEQRRSTSISVTDSHSLYFQTLAELGIVGFGLMAISILGVLVILARRCRGRERSVYAVLFAVACVWAVHTGVDWDWEMPAATLWLFIIGGAALASSPAHPPVGQTRNRTGLAVGWLVLAIAPLLIGVSYQRLRVSGEELAAGNCVKARQSAFSSISLLTARPEPYQILSFCDLELGFPSEGLAAARKAVHYEQDNWNYRYGLAIALAENGINPRPAARQALKLNPHEPIVRAGVAALSGTKQRDWERLAPVLLIGALQSGQLAVSNL
jgi:O-Antigen ligase